MNLDGKFLASVIADVVFIGEQNPSFGRFVIDSRRVVPGVTFVALTGSQHDGHDFLPDAIDRGAQCCIIDAAKKDSLKVLSKDQLTQVTIILVPSAYQALITLASAWRSLFTCPVVGITGSIGKTTTKELLGAMVRASGKSCLISEGNYNTLLGAAMTLLQLRPEHTCAIVEMGISRRGEMAQLAQLIRPSIGVITTIAHQHMDGLGALADIALEKRDIFKFFKADNIGIICGDQPLLSAVSYPHPVVRFGYKTTNQIQARRVVVKGTRIEALIKLYTERFSVVLSTPHKGRLLSFLASASAAYFLSVPSSAIIKALEEFEAVPGRFQPIPLMRGKGVVINDSYNANPESMKEALWAFDRLDVRGKKVAILGDMLGLGTASSFWHRQLGRSLRKTQTIERVVFVGSHVRDVEKTMPRGFAYSIVPDWRTALKEVEVLVGNEEQVALLVKASQGIELQFLVDNLVTVS